MNELHEMGLTSYDTLSNGMIVVSFDDNISLTYANELSLNQDCTQYDSEVIENLRKYIVCYCANVDALAILGKKFVFDLEEPNGNIVKII
jgi:hypothetical protein